MEATPRRPHPILDALLEVHRTLGPGWPAPVCAAAVEVELRGRRIAFERDVATELWYRGQLLPSSPSVAFVVDGGCPLDVRCVERLSARDETPVLHHLRSRGGGHGLVVNFGAARLQVRRVHAAGAPQAVAPLGPGTVAA